MYLSSWELNQKAPHPKHVERIIDYLGYMPNITSKFEKLGTRTKLYRMKHNISIEEFCQMGNININVIMKLETMRFCKPLKTEVRAIKRQLNRKPTFSSEVC